jgi:multiple sugar transport system substrate-binding protein
MEQPSPFSALPQQPATNTVANTTDSSSVNPTVSPTSPFDSPLSSPSKSGPLDFLQKQKKLLFILFGIIVLVGVGFLAYSFFVKKGVGKKQVTLTYWGLFEPEPVFQQVIADYEKAHPNVKINYSMENLRDYRQRLQTALARQGTGTKSDNSEIPLRESPDIFRIHLTWVPMLGNYLSAVPADVYDSPTFEKTFYPSAKENLRRQGQYVGIPLGIDSLVLYYNEDLLKSAGKTPPRSWSELKRLACELTVYDSQGKLRTSGVAMGTTNNVDHWSDILGLMMLQNGADLSKPASCSQESGAAVGEGEVCLGRDALTFYTIFASEHACSDMEDKPGAVWDSLQPNSTYAFTTGRVAMYFGPTWRAFEIKELNPNLNFKMIPTPKLEEKKLAWATYWVEAVSKNSPNQPEAWEFLKYLSSKEVLEKLYQAQSALRDFGEPYPRVDMASLLLNQPMVSAVIEQAPYATTWYLSSRTSDNGINDQIIKYYEDAVNSVNNGGDPLSALNTTTQGVGQILRQYGLVR